MFTNTLSLKQHAEICPKVGAKYATINTDTLVGRIRAVAPDTTISFRGSYSRRAVTTKHIIEAKLNGLSSSEGVPQVYILNSYNGESALVIRVGFYRFICSNGLVVGKDFFCRRIIHRKGQTVDQFLEDFDKILIAAIEQMTVYLESKIESMKVIQVNFSKQRQIIESLNLPAKTKEIAIEMRHTPTRWEDENDNLWALYNTINEAIRIRSRSGMADFKKNDTLMEDVIRLAA